MKAFTQALRAAVMAGLLALTSSPAHAAPGNLDPLNAAVVGSYVSASVMQPDGKTIIAGSFTSVLGQPRNNIARLNADGTLDAGFNPDVNSDVRCVAVQADGQILLGGLFTIVGGITRNRIARVDATGTLDGGFNPDANAVVYSMVMQVDGRILLGGNFTSVNGITRNRIARVDASGALDQGFNPDANYNVLCVAVQADGRVLLGGLFTSVGGITRNRIARVDAAGTLDAGFNPNANDEVSCIAEQADGRILFGGHFTTVSGTSRNRFARVNATGILDAAFNPNAGTNVRFQDDGVYSTVVQADGGILLGGWLTTVGGIARNSLARVDVAGALDTGFNPIASFGVLGVAVQADGRILAGGRFDRMGGLTRSRFARLLNDPATQALNAPDATQFIWSRGGSSPEVSQVTFEHRAEGGTTWTPLGSGTRIGSTPNWQLIGLTLPASGQLRARGRTSGGDHNGSSSLVELVASLPLVPAPPAPTVASISPPSGSTVGGTSVTITGTDLSEAFAVRFGSTAATTFSVIDATTISATTPARAAGAVNVVVTTLSGTSTGIFTYITPPPTVALSTARLLDTATMMTIKGTGFSTTPGNNSVSFTPAGTGIVTEATATSLTVSNLSGLALGALNAVIISNGVSSGADVQVATVIASRPGDVDPLDATVIGSNVHASAVQPDGKTIIGGNFTSVLGQPRNRIARLNADGTLDASFNPNVSGSVLSMAVQADGRILLAGSFPSVSGISRNCIARLNADGTLDAGFSPDANGNVSSVVMQSDGRILLGGYFTTIGGTTRNRIARVEATGALDADFDPNANEFVGNVAVQANGRILLGGTFTSVGGTARNSFARLANDPATQTLSAPDASQLIWTRGGSSPEVSLVTFEISTVSGATWTLLGSGTRIGSTSNWQLTGLSLTGSGQLRARGRTSGGYSNGSSGLVEQVVSFNGLLTPLETWRQTHFGTTANTGDAADSFDFDKDGLVNLIEFAFGLDPKLPSSTAQLPQPSLSGGNFAFSFTPPDGVSGIAYGAEWSTSLHPGSWTSIPNTGIAPQHLFSLPTTGQPKMYTRLVVTAP